MDVVKWATGMAAILGLLVLIGAALVLIKGSFNKAQIEALRNDNIDLRARTGDCEHQIKIHEATEEKLELRISALEREKALLLDSLTQRADITELTQVSQQTLAELERHNVASEQAWAGIAASISDAVHLMGVRMGELEAKLLEEDDA